MAAFRPDDSDERDVRLEDFGQHVRGEDFYAEWDGALDDAITEAALLCDGIASFEEPPMTPIEAFIAAGEHLMATIERVMQITPEEWAA
jgi:hypothetical protein